jgi:DNA-binding transcriptional ArsR family regulator
MTERARRPKPGPRLRGALGKHRLTYVTAYTDVSLSILGDPTRQAIFELLARRPCSVGEIAEQLPITRQAVSQHLRVLKEGGLVVATPDGTRRIYRLNPDGVAALHAYFQRIWDDALTAFQKAADAATNPIADAATNPVARAATDPEMEQP